MLMFLTLLYSLKTDTKALYFLYEWMISFTPRKTLLLKIGDILENDWICKVFRWSFFMMIYYKLCFSLQKNYPKLEFSHNWMVDNKPPYLQIQNERNSVSFRGLLEVQCLFWKLFFLLTFFSKLSIPLQLSVISGLGFTEGFILHPTTCVLYFCFIETVFYNHTFSIVIFLKSGRNLRN